LVAGHAGGETAGLTCTIEHFVLPLEEDIVNIDDAEDRAQFEEDFKADVAALLGVEIDQVVPKARYLPAH
jgi:hypothetical protein